MHDLDAHTWDVHDESIECNLCDQTFEKDNDLLEHKKESHNLSEYIYTENCFTMHVLQRIFCIQTRIGGAQEDKTP